MPKISLLAIALLLWGCASGPDPSRLAPTTIPSIAPLVAPTPELKVEIQSPASDVWLTGSERWIDLEGGASVFGGIRFLELVLVIDTSKSLQKTDPRNHRTAGAVALIESFPAKDEMRVGVVSFNRKAKLVLPLSSDRSATVAALRRFKREGGTNLAAGIRTALEELDRSLRPDASRVILLFTDGKSNGDEARAAMGEARARGVAVHTLLLGSDEEGEAILREIAAGTGASFLHVVDPARLPETFLKLRTTGIERVTLRVNDSSPIPAQLAGGTFSARVPLSLGLNRIVASATSLDGETREDEVTVVVSGPMALTIETPQDGLLFTDHRKRTHIQGYVTPFTGVFSELPLETESWALTEVVLRVNDTAPVVAKLSEGHFQASVLLEEGTNRIRAEARTRDGRRTGADVIVTLRPPGCAELRVQAFIDGRPALSISQRAIELVVDASNSMWGRIDGQPKISLAKATLKDALDWLPADLGLALRVYGHQHPREAHACTDSSLLVALEPDNRQRIREAIASFRPRGQTPLAYSLEQVAKDFADFAGERAVVLVTDGIESCGGDPEQVARKLGAAGIPVHVIGFGLGSKADEDSESLRAIASASGGQFVLARSAQELRHALSTTVGTPYRVLQGDRVIGRGTLGANIPMRLPAGDYRIALASSPPREAQVRLTSEKGLTFVLEREGSQISQTTRSHEVAYSSCGQAAAPPASSTHP